MTATAPPKRPSRATRVRVACAIAASIALLVTPSRAPAQAEALRDSIARIDARDLFYVSGRPITRSDLEFYLEGYAISNALVYGYDESIDGIRGAMRGIVAETATRRAALARQLESLESKPGDGSTDDGAADELFARARRLSPERACQLRKAFAPRGGPEPDCDDVAGDSARAPTATDLEKELVDAIAPSTERAARLGASGRVVPPASSRRDDDRERAAYELYEKTLDELTEHEREVVVNLGDAIYVSRHRTPKGLPAFPGLSAALPVIGRLAVAARSDPVALVAMRRFLALLLRNDFRGIESSTPPATEAGGVS